MTHHAQQYATQFVNVHNVKCNVKKLPAPSAQFTVLSQSALFVVLRMNVKLQDAQNVKPYANQLNATQLVLLQNQNVLQFVNNSTVNTSVLSQQTVLSQSVNYNVKSLPVKLLLNKHNAAHALKLLLKLLSLELQTLVVLNVHLYWKLYTLSSTPSNKARNNAAHAPTKSAGRKKGSYQ